MFTPTEAAGVTVVYAAVMGAFYYRRLNFKNLPKVLLASGLESGMVMLLIAMSEPFAWFVAADQIPQLIIEWISHVTTSPYVILLLVNIFLLLLGIPMETAPALVIVTPVLVPIAASVGIDPVHMGIVVCLNLVLGLITPPVGAVLFAVCGMTNMSLDRLSRAIWPPFLVSLVGVGHRDLSSLAEHLVAQTRARALGPQDNDRDIRAGIIHMIRACIPK